MVDDHTTPNDPARERARCILQDENSRSLYLVGLADNKTAILVGLMTAIISLVGLVLALVITIMAPRATLGVVVSSCAALICFLAAVASFSFAMWPRLEGLPNDPSPQAMCARIERVAQFEPPSDLEYRLAYGAQQIGLRKNWAVRCTIVSMLLLIVFCGLALGACWW